MKLAKHTDAKNQTTKNGIQNKTNNSPRSWTQLQFFFPFSQQLASVSLSIAQPEHIPNNMLEKLAMYTDAKVYSNISFSFILITIKPKWKGLYLEHV